MYGRTILEVIVVQVLLLGAIMFVPFDLIEAVGAGGAGLIAAATSGALALLLCVRHMGRAKRAGERGFNRETSARPA